MMDARIDRAPLQEDGLHYHVYRPMPDPRNPGMITHYLANPEPIASRTTANREAKEQGLPFLNAPAMVRQCRAPLSAQLYIQAIAKRVRERMEAEDPSQNPPDAEGPESDTKSKTL